MTLLEAMVALVILGLSATGFLELFQQVSSQTAVTASRAEVLAVAEATMERAILDGAAAPAPSDSAGLMRRLEWRAHPSGLRELVVTVEAPRGGRVELHRLVGTP